MREAKIKQCERAQGLTSMAEQMSEQVRQWWFGLTGLCWQRGGFTGTNHKSYVLYQLPDVLLAVALSD